jgi:hypothetical protein
MQPIIKDGSFNIKEKYPDPLCRHIDRIFQDFNGIFRQRKVNWSPFRLNWYYFSIISFPPLVFSTVAILGRLPRHFMPHKSI